MLEIPLSHGKYALIDNEDLELVMRYNWLYSKPPRSHTGYALATIKKNGKFSHIAMHRLLMNPPKGMVVDHKNGNGIDNSRNNLRVCTNRQNIQNTIKRTPLTSKYKGVSYHKDTKTFKATITYEKKCHSLGYFHEEIEAARAYNKAASAMFKEYASLNALPYNENVQHVISAASFGVSYIAS